MIKRYAILISRSKITFHEKQEKKDVKGEKDEEE